jgi:hypothetical protein
MPNLRKYTSWLLLTVFGYILTPAALIHELHGHEDTRCIPGSVAAVGVKHVHCKSLQIEAQVFTPPGTLLLAALSGNNSPVRIAKPASPSCASVLFTDPRAPPAG